MQENAIRITRLVKVFREGTSRAVTAVDGVSLDVPTGTIFGLLGPNGAGKTTMLRIITTLIPPTSGTVTVMGSDVMRDPLEVRKKICVVLQENAVELFLSVRDNLLTYGRFHSVPRHEVRERIDRVLTQFGLQEYATHKVIDLSGGLKRRLQVAKVFMVDKPVVFLDEATTGMDPLNKRATITAIRGQAEQGRTIFLTTHLLDEAEELCDTIAIVDKGKCIATGDPQTIKSLVSNSFDIVIRFETITDNIVRQLQSLPLLRYARKDTTIELSIKAENLMALEVISNLAKSDPVRHLEVHSSSLEDAFLELLHGSEIDR